MLSGKMLDVQQQLRTDRLLGSKVLLLSFTVDPAHDTPEKLSGYAQRVGADPEHWRFLTGTPNEIQRVVVGGFRVGFIRPEPSSRGKMALPLTIKHTNRFVMVDGEGKIRGYLPGGETSPSDMVQMIRKFVR